MYYAPVLPFHRCSLTWLTMKKINDCHSANPLEICPSSTLHLQVHKNTDRIRQNMSRLCSPSYLSEVSRSDAQQFANFKIKAEQKTPSNHSQNTFKNYYCSLSLPNLRLTGVTLVLFKQKLTETAQILNTLTITPVNLVRSKYQRWRLT